jgi:hypothetical protein
MAWFSGPLIDPAPSPPLSQKPEVRETPLVVRGRVPGDQLAYGLTVRPQSRFLNFGDLGDGEERRHGPAAIAPPMS